MYEAEALQDSEDESGAESTDHVTSSSWLEAEETDTSDEEVCTTFDLSLLCIIIVTVYPYCTGGS